MTAQTDKVTLLGHVEGIVKLNIESACIVACTPAQLALFRIWVILPYHATDVTLLLKGVIICLAFVSIVFMVRVLCSYRVFRRGSVTTKAAGFHCPAQPCFLWPASLRSNQC